MGAAAHDIEAESDEKPLREVWLSSFEIQASPVTVGEYGKFLQSRGEGPFALERPETPITNVSWLDCVHYAAWLSVSTGQSWRLPTEAEWEKACRGVDGRLYPWVATRRPAWEDEALSDGALPVEYPRPCSWSVRRSPYGCSDMWMNVLEWCADWYEERYYDRRVTLDPQGPALGVARVVRGGNLLASGWPRCSKRTSLDPLVRLPTLGFRLVRDVNASG
jgi:sulfatase modifying factor 1